MVPTEAHASLIVDVLWRTGLPWAQAKARQLFDAATQPRCVHGMAGWVLCGWPGQYEPAGVSWAMG